MQNEPVNQPSRHRGTGVLAVILKNSAANLAKIAALSVTVFLLPPLLVRVLDKPVYATWVLILQIGTYVALIDGSIQSAISRFTGRSRGLNDGGYMGRMLSSAGLVMLGAAAVTAILTILGSWQCDPLSCGSLPRSGRMHNEPCLFLDRRWLSACLFRRWPAPFSGYK